MGSIIKHQQHGQFFSFYFHNAIKTRQSAQQGTYTPDQRYRQFLKSTKYVALTVEMAGIYFML